MSWHKLYLVCAFFVKKIFFGIKLHFFRLDDRNKMRYNEKNVMFYDFQSKVTLNINSMEMIILGTIGFFFYFLYDINSVKENHPVLRYFFAVGTLCLVVSTIGTMIMNCDMEQIKKTIGILLLAVGICFFVLLIYTLFFALPFEETYLEESRERLAYTEGMYGLCRHPGVLWFAGLYLCLWGLTGLTLEGIFFPVMILWNVLYIIFQDLWTFPRTFSNYLDYKKTTPFLIPNKKSIRVCISTWKDYSRDER